MLAKYELITFDVYTALFDIESSLRPSLTGALGSQVDVRTLLRAWRSKQLEYAVLTNSLGQGRVSFRVVTRRALDYTLTKAGLSVSELQSEALVDEWDRLQPWPEAVSILNQVQARGYQVGLLSNGDHAMLTKLIGTLPVTVHHIFSSEQAGYYKPHPAVYQLPLQALTLKPAQVLHVAGSPTDVLGTKAAGLPCYWSNRSNDILIDPAVRADYVFDNLAGLLELL